MSVPGPSQWPVDPQQDQEILKERIWIDGCFDFAHHGKPVLSRVDFDEGQSD